MRREVYNKKVAEENEKQESSKRMAEKDEGQQETKESKETGDVENVLADNLQSQSIDEN